MTDATGAVLPGVSITVAGDALMSTRTTLTSTEGLYRLPALPPGTYRLSFAREGFRTLEREGIALSLGFTATIDAALEVAVSSEPVRVDATRTVVGRHSTALTAALDSRQLASLPSSRSMFALLASTPAVHVARMEVGGSSGVAGGPYSAYGTRGSNQPMVEGIIVTGIFPAGFTLDYGSFEEVSVLTGAHGPEWASPGVHMQFIAKSGATNIAERCTPTTKTGTGRRATWTGVKSIVERRVALA